MKNTILLLLIGFLCVSCRKEYTCSCTADDPIHNISTSKTLSRPLAEEWCKDWSFDDQIDEDTKKEGWKCVLIEE